MNKRYVIFFILFCSWITSSYAICPICTLAVGAGVGLSRWLGVDDTVTGLWIGGLTVSMILWTIFWADKKNIFFTGRNLIIIIGYYLLVLFPLRWGKLLFHPLNTFWGMDKLILGLIVGSLLFALGGVIHFYLKKRNQQCVYFPFQKVVFPVVPLILASIIFYLLT